MSAVLTLFTGLLVAIIVFQVYRGVVAFGNPDQEVERPAQTPRSVWLLAILAFIALFIGAAFIGARIFGDR